MTLVKGQQTRNKSHQADTKDLEQKIKDIEQENASLKTIMSIREDEYKGFVKKCTRVTTNDHEWSTTSDFLCFPTE